MHPDTSSSALRQPFLEAMSRITSTVCVVTTDGPGGLAGTTVTAMSPVSADSEAPSLLICLHAQSHTAKAIIKNASFAVNVLSDQQIAIADQFAGRNTLSGCNKFDGVEAYPGQSGCPHLNEAVAVFDCDLKLQQPWGSHLVFIGEVSDVLINHEKSALTYANRNYVNLKL